MKSIRNIFCLGLCLFSLGLVAQVKVDNSGAAAKGNKGGAAQVKKNEVSIKSGYGGGVVTNNKGSEIKNKKGGGVEAHKGGVAAKSGSDKGVQADKKGLNVKGSKGGMTIDKKKLQIKSKNVNIKLGKD